VTVPVGEGGGVCVAKDTVLVALLVAGRAGHVEQHQPRVVRLVDDHLVQLHRRVHPPDVRVVSERGRRERGRERERERERERAR